MSKEIQPHQQRVIDEKTELDIKLASLDAFIEGSLVFDGLPHEEKVGSRGQGYTEAKAYPLADLTPEALDQLCDQFRKGVFAKAGKKDPRLEKRP